MKVYVILEHRFDRTPDGRLWTVTQFPYKFWLRYLDVFENVCIVARVQNVTSVDGTAQRVDGFGVSYAALSHYIGPLQFILKCLQVRKVVNSVLKEKDALILRVPSIISLTIPKKSLFARPFGLEVVADPWDIFAPGAIKHPLRVFFRHLLTSSMKNQIRKSAAAAYVTQHTLQKRYATKKMYWYSDAEISNSIHDFHFSSVELPSVDLTLSRNSRAVLKIITVGSLSTHYKGVDILLEAMSILLKQGQELRLSVLGDGKVRGELEKQSRRLGVSHLVEFAGNIPSGDSVFERLDDSDLFVLASRTEGLPRALIEAMSRGLPCLGSAVGGIPELLDEDCLFEPGNAPELAAKISSIRLNSDRLKDMSRRNLLVAKSFEAGAVALRRKEFYEFVRSSTEAWTNGF